MRRFVLSLAFVLICASAKAESGAYSVYWRAGGVMLTSGTVFDFKPGVTYGLGVGHALGGGWSFDLDVSAGRFANKTTNPLADSLGSIHNNASIDFKAVRIGGLLTKLVFSENNRVNLEVGAGGGLMVWKMVDPGSGATLETIGEHQGKLDFAASELFVSASTGLLIFPARQWSLGLDFHADYLTGAGPTFAAQVNQARDRWLLGATFALGFHFGGRGSAGWKSTPDWQAQQAAFAVSRTPLRDSDADGVPDDSDMCPNTPRGVVVDAHGCPVDSDGDGVPDGLDDCPGTPGAAYGRVDIHGCPIDADFDGVPDYLDRCPDNSIGATVDSVGCPVDSDGDGVPDGLDDCPNTLPGTPVDRYGCIDVAIFAEPMVLNIDYIPGSFEIDARAKQRLERLGRLLSMVSDIKLEINAYTDDIGTADANLKLSEKRANRVRDFLVANGVSTERLKPVGRGETNPVASNQTAEGRQRNRRIEIVFYK
jgi:OOP family OmpA-OmpF porin